MSTALVHLPSHPLHPLTLAPFPTHPSSSFFCNSGNLSGDGFSYTCSYCDFDLHLHCALAPNYPNPLASPSPVLPLNFNTQIANNMPPPAAPIDGIKHFSHPHVLKQVDLDGKTTELCAACEFKLSGSGAYSCTEPYCVFGLHEAGFDSPPVIQHRFHPHQHLTLLPAPRYGGGSFTCDACRKGGKAFAYACGACTYDLHIDCIRWPDTLTRSDHEHPLALFCSSRSAAESGGGGRLCSVCRKATDEKAWVYYCRECDFGTHLECVNAEIKPQSAAAAGGSNSSEEQLLKLHQQKLDLDTQLHMVKLHGQFMASLANSWTI